MDKQPEDATTRLYTEMIKRVQGHLVQANEELLGLHRYGAMTYDQYADVAGMLLDAQDRLKAYMGETVTPRGETNDES